ncbi:MAG TPA: cbb3-type cytochrome c oxidase subunit II, partial [Verrucomicrobiae bacterium]|nr:cbb3-type cytochrome c oxidase subunit II [Verrucomicrobiae bacterium]
EQVRPEGYGTDVERGWGARKGRVQSVDEDYLFEQTVMLGCQRVGPDLANIGCRQTNAAVLLKHIYDARLVLPNSIMPPYRFLFEERLLKPGQAPAADALDLGDKAPLGKEVVPTEQARQLAAYLLSLHETGVIFETPPPQPPPTNAPAAATNASATNTAK